MRKNIWAALGATGGLSALALIFPPLLPLIAWIATSALLGVLTYIGAVRRSPWTPKILLGLGGVAGVFLIAAIILVATSPIILLFYSVRGGTTLVTFVAAGVVLVIGQYVFGQGRGSEFALAIAILVGLAFFQAQTGLHFVTVPLIGFAVLAWYIKAVVTLPILATLATLLLILDMANVVLPDSMNAIYAVVANGITRMDATLGGFGIGTAQTGATYWWNTTTTVKRVCNEPRMQNGVLSCATVGPVIDVPASPPLVLVATKGQRPFMYEQEAWVFGYARPQRHRIDKSVLLLMPASDLKWSVDNPPISEQPTTTGGGTPPGVLTPTVVGKTIIVDGNSMWTETGLMLHPGDVLTVDATGEVNGNTNRQDASFKSVGPDGWGEDPTINWTVGGAPAVWILVLGRGSSYMCLTGRIGHGAPFKVGSHFHASVDGTGDLLLGINSPISDHTGKIIRNIDDLNRGAWSNQGQLACTIQIHRKSG